MRTVPLFILWAFLLSFATLADIRKSTGTTNNLGSSVIPEYGEFQGILTDGTRRIKLLNGTLLRIEDMPMGLTRFTEPTNLTGNQSYFYGNRSGRWRWAICLWRES
jgi:hypothetical protein